MINFRYILGWVFVRPRRWLFWKMVCATRLQLRPFKRKWDGWYFTNIHWWLLYKTVFQFCKWLNYDAWRPFCDWTGGYRRTFPLIARIIHRMGHTTAGYATSGGECYHCGSEEGDPVRLADNETGTTFTLTKTWENATQEGTDYCLCGTTICPKCGYKAYYEDGSL